jgi:DeoR/GlpR family transcriptional regulator of sugar metabolism
LEINMGSAVSSVFGGGGSGGILGAVGGIVGGIFGGPIGAMIGQAIGNMLQQAIGDATKQAVDTLQKEHGMPKFLADEVKTKVDGIIGGLQQPVSADASKAAQQFAPHFEEFKNDLAQSLVKMVKEQLEGQDDGNGKGSSSTKSTKGGSWLEALAKAMGNTLGQKAAKMVELGDKIAQTAGGEGKEAAKANTEATMEMQATGQMFNLMQNAFSAAIKSIGEGLSQAARKG